MSTYYGMQAALTVHVVTDNVPSVTLVIDNSVKLLPTEVTIVPHLLVGEPFAKVTLDNRRTGGLLVASFWWGSLTVKDEYTLTYTAVDPSVTLESPEYRYSPSKGLYLGNIVLQTCQNTHNLIFNIFD